MKKYLLVVVIAWIGVTSAQGQEPGPGFQFFAGLSVMTGQNIADEGTPMGGEISVLFNMNPHWGILADFGMSLQSSDSSKHDSFDFLSGPQFAARGERVSAFFRPLAGISIVRKAHPIDITSEDGSLDCRFGMFYDLCPTEEFHVTNRVFTAGVGGGLDLNADGTVSVRLIQFDYLPYRLDGQWSHRYRIGAGFVINLGGESAD